MTDFTKRIIYSYVIIFAILFILNFLDVISSLFLTSAIYAGVLNLINAFAAVRLFKISYKSGAKSFMIYNLGGLGVRLIILMICIVLVIKFLNIDEYGFILVFFLFYFISLIFEVLFYLKIANKRQ